MMLPNACNATPIGGPTLPSAYVEMPYSELVLGELAPDILASPGIPGCSLADLRPLGSKAVDCGIV